MANDIIAALFLFIRHLEVYSDDDTGLPKVGMGCMISLPAEDPRIKGLFISSLNLLARGVVPGRFLGRFPRDAKVVEQLAAHVPGSR
jgi:hypothetical protein